MLVFNGVFVGVHLIANYGNLSLSVSYSLQSLATIVFVGNQGLLEFFEEDNLHVER